MFVDARFNMVVFHHMVPKAAINLYIGPGLAAIQSLLYLQEMKCIVYVGSV